MGKKIRKKVINKMELANHNLDDISETSSISDLWGVSSIPDTKLAEDNEVETEVSLEDKLFAVCEDLTNKSVNVRIPALEQLRNILSSHYIPEIIDSRKMDILSSLEKCVKRTQSPRERVLAAFNISLVFTQIFFFSPDVALYWNQISPMLAEIYKFKSNDTQVREACLLTHTFCTYLVCQACGPGSDIRIQDVPDTLEVLEECFRTQQKAATVPKAKDRDMFIHVPLHTEAEEKSNEKIADFRARALNCWSLLITAMDRTQAKPIIEKIVPYLLQKPLNLELTSSIPLPIKMAACECLAICYEIYPDLFSKPLQSTTDSEVPQQSPANYLTEIVAILTALVADNPKYTSKREQRVSRNLFRRILQTFQHALSMNDGGHHNGTVGNNVSTISSIKTKSPPEDQLSDIPESPPLETTKISATNNPAINLTQIKADNPVENTFLLEHRDEKNGFKMENIRIGRGTKEENIKLESWIDVIQYEILCLILGHGAIIHLRDNDGIRHLFNLGPSLSYNAFDGDNGLSGSFEVSKRDKQAEMMAQDKTRTISLQKARHFKNANRNIDSMLVEE